MTPTLFGRIQTRLVVLATVGVFWTAIVSPFLPRPADVELKHVYIASLTAVFIVAFAGIVWELIYHALQQYRWEKDWPTIFGLLVGIPEGVVVWLCLTNNIPWPIGQVHANTFLTHFISTWIVVWAFINGPLQIFTLRWRYQGGRFFGGW